MPPGATPLRNLGANALQLGRRALARLVLPSAPGFWLRVEVSGSLPDVAAGWSPPGAPAPPAGLLPVLESLERAADDPRVSGVLLRLVAAPSGMAQVLSLRRALLGVRSAGKPVVAWGERWSSGELLLASAATRVLMPEAGSVYLVGLGMESFFVKELLDRLGLAADVVRTGDFKTAAETFTRSGMSERQREQALAVLDDGFGALVSGIAEGRGMEDGRVRELVDGGPYGARAAAEAGLIDACCFPDEVEDVLRELAGESEAGPGAPPVPVADVSAYHALRVRRAFHPWLRGLPRIAYVVASGLIHPGSSRLGIASDAYRELLRRLEKDAGVRAVVLRVESPGGDGLASDLLWRSVRRLAAEKPVVVSMGEVAASGGYYLAVAADAIVAEPVSLTGSIGVVGGKLNVAGALERLGVRSERLERGARAGLLSVTRAFTQDERAALRGELREAYDRFVARVAEGRKMSPAAVRAVARGRVWSGARAHDLGLVDLLGGPLEALAEARRRAGIRPGEAFAVDAHPRARLGTLLGSLRRPRWML